MAPRKKATWLLIGDGAKAQIYAINAIPLRIKKVEGGAFRGSRKTTPVIEGAMSEVSGQDAGGAPHAIERHTDAHQRHEDKFVERVADAIDMAAAQGKFQDIIVVFPPKALAHFRKIVSAGVRKKIKKQIRSEWTHLRIPEIEKHLKDRLP